MSNNTITQAFNDFMALYKAENSALDYPPSLAVAFYAGSVWSREQCAKVAEQAGWDFEQERAQGKYIAERIRDGDKPI